NHALSRCPPLSMMSTICEASDVQGPDSADSLISASNARRFCSIGTGLVIRVIILELFLAVDDITVSPVLVIVFERRNANLADFLKPDLLDMDIYLSVTRCNVPVHSQTVVGFITPVCGPAYVVRRRHRNISLFILHHLRRVSYKPYVDVGVSGEPP